MKFNKLSSQLSVEIQVKDVNDNRPNFDKNTYEADVREDLLGGSKIVQVFASDPDEGDNGRISYSFSNKTKHNHGFFFSIDSASGWIKLKSQSGKKEILDHEKEKQFVLEVVAKDFGEGESFDVALVIIKVLSFILYSFRDFSMQMLQMIDDICIFNGMFC